MNEETCPRYYEIKMSSAALDKIRVNSTKIIKKDTELIENMILTFKLQDSGTVCE